MSQSQTQSSHISNVRPPLKYSPAKGYVDEVFGPDGDQRKHWTYLLDSLKNLGADGLANRQNKALRILRDDGATYNIYGDDASLSQTWELDLVPALISSEQWGVIESGLLERAELFNAILKDIYGPRELIRNGVIPPEALFSHSGFLRPCQGIVTPGEQELILHAVDMVRDADGEMCALTDRTQAPSGMGYALENRTVMSRVLPSLFRESQVHRLATFFQRLRHKLASMSEAHDQPRIVLLSPGAHNETYFEHAYLANYLGFPLVQSGDLVVRNGFVWMKSLDGLSRVDVILRRVDDWFCDPVELRGDSQLGVPGLLEVVRANRVVIANPLGSGVLENPVFLKYLPEISKQLLGREPRMKSIPTYWCGDKKDMAYVEAHFEQMVVKPISRSSGRSSVWTQQLTKVERQQWLNKIKAQPAMYVAQPCLIAGHVPTFTPQGLQPRPAIVRSYAVAFENSYYLMPGGLTRVGTEEGAFLISGQAGSQSKDTWVIASEPEPTAAEQASIDAAIIAGDEHLMSLPSRVVENLFWMGRYAERAEASLRILRTVFVLLNGEEVISNTCRKYLLQAVSAITATLPGFQAEELQEDPDQELLLLAQDPNRAGSVHYNLNAMLRCADESKELLSSDTLRVINDIRDGLDGLKDALSGGMASAPEEALDPFVTALMALAGLARESMVHGVGWQFMEIGRRIERGVQTICIMDQLLTPVLKESDQNTLMQALLTSVEGLISYRRRYRARMGVKQVLELVMMDTSNPRSLLFQFNELKNHLTSLPKQKLKAYELSPDERVLLEGETAIRLVSLDELCEEQLIETASDDSSKLGSLRRKNLASRLQQFNLLLGDLSIVISEKHFEHRIGPQQLVSRLSEEF